MASLGLNIERANGRTIAADGKTFVGNGNKIRGNKNTVVGNGCEVIGNDCLVRGNRNKGSGNRNTVEGIENEWWGRDNQILGKLGKSHEGKAPFDTSELVTLAGKKRKAEDKQTLFAEDINGIDLKITFDMEEMCCEIFYAGETLRQAFMRPGETVKLSQLDTTAVLDENGTLTIHRPNDPMRPYTTSVKFPAREVRLAKTLSSMISRGAKGVTPSTRMPAFEQEQDAPEGTPDDFLCMVCYTRARTTLFQPCGHSTCCISCARKLMMQKEIGTCPSCKAKVATCAKIYRA